MNFIPVLMTACLLYTSRAAIARPRGRVMLSQRRACGAFQRQAANGYLVSRALLHSAIGQLLLIHAALEASLQLHMIAHI